MKKLKKTFIYIVVACVFIDSEPSDENIYIQYKLYFIVCNSKAIQSTVPRAQLSFFV